MHARGGATNYPSNAAHIGIGGTGSPPSAPASAPQRCDLHELYPKVTGVRHRRGVLTRSSTEQLSEERAIIRKPTTFSAMGTAVSESAWPPNT
jgi:hypothetical protein